MLVFYGSHALIAWLGHEEDHLTYKFKQIRWNFFIQWTKTVQI